MSKTKTKVLWVCSSCGHSQPKWTGSCSHCREWNTLKEEIITAVKEEKFAASAAKRDAGPKRPILIRDVLEEDIVKIPLSFKEVSRVLGGGVTPGALTLIGGDPGIGKSTLLLSLAADLSRQGKKVLYVTGEESLSQTKDRAKRLQIDDENIYLLHETQMSHIVRQVIDVQPDIFILDSIQIVYKEEIPSLPGSMSQVKEVAMECMHIAKAHGITTFVIGHVTKSGDLAGPKVLEHIVDTVLEFEGDKQHGYRLLRTIKNRFGPTDEVAVLQMQPTGLKEVDNPSKMMLEERINETFGSVVVPTVEGSRALLLEIQALVAQSAFSNSMRKATGFDLNRLTLLMAVLEKKLGYHFHQLDVFISVIGGLKILERAADLAVMIALTSSFLNREVPHQCVVIGEVGLNGEVRAVSRMDQRLKEAIHLGFTKAIVPAKSINKIDKALKSKIELVFVDQVQKAIEELLV